MKFAHLADMHIGCWQEPKMRELSNQAFRLAINQCVEEKVDFVLMAGDLFNTSLPSMDNLKETVEKLKELKELNIPVYCIAGSHDYSPSGKTMLQVLEKAGLLLDVCKGNATEDNKLQLKFTLDPKTGAKITGMFGKKGMLDKHYYDDLDLEHLEKEEGFKIFMFHTELTEYKPQELSMIESIPLSVLPKNFDYYGAGHIHIKRDKTFENYGPVMYTGPLFPVNFKELEAGTGGFWIYDDGDIRYKPLEIIKIEKIHLDCNHKTSEQVTQLLLSQIEGKNFKDTIVLMRLKGLLKEGKPTDIKFKEIFDKLYELNAYYVMKNTSKLESKQFEEIKIESSSIDELEDALIKEHVNQFDIGRDAMDLTKEVMHVLNAEKAEGEVSKDFELRILDEMKRVVGDL